MCKASGHLRNGEAWSGIDVDLTVVMTEKLFQYYAWICGYCKHASPSYGYTPRMIQLYQLTFCGYACSQCLLLCFSVAQRHQEAVPTVNIDGHDDYHAWICEYRKHASTPYGYIPRTVQLYQLKFCGYACSQYIPSCFSVAKCHQEAVPTVNNDGYDDYASCMDM